MSPRVTAAERFQRIVSIVPWIAQRPGVTIAAVCEQFDIEREELLADLDVVFMVGVPPYTPDELIDVMIEDDEISIRLGDYFTRPLNLTAVEALAVVAGAAVMLAVPGADETGPLATALEKVRAGLGFGAEAAVEVSLGGVDPEVLSTLRAAITDRETLRINYYSHSSDAYAERSIDPLLVAPVDGNWYVRAWCHTANGLRVFRVDRIATVTRTGLNFDRSDLGVSIVLTFPEATSRVTLAVPEADMWMLDRYPVEAEHRVEDTRVITLALGGSASLERLMLQLGPETKVLEYRDGDLADGDSEIPRLRARAAAERIAQRYRSGSGHE
jgi:proteasome accessory factor C